LERSHSENVEPRVLRTTRWWRQESHSPAGGAGIAAIVAGRVAVEVLN